MACIQSRAAFWLRQPFFKAPARQHLMELWAVVWPRPVTDAHEATERRFIKRRRGPITLPLTYWGLIPGWGVEGWAVKTRKGVGEDVKHLTHLCKNVQACDYVCFFSSTLHF